MIMSRHLYYLFNQNITSQIISKSILQVINELDKRSKTSAAHCNARKRNNVHKRKKPQMLQK